MNYRHIYHAGNFADVLKHILLVRVIEYMKRKQAAFRVIDTHAGIGLYDLSSTQAQKTGEWKAGIARLMDGTRDLSVTTGALIAPYLDCIHTLNPDGGVLIYPGSAKLTRLLLRRQDRLSALELHPQDQARLAQLFAGDHQVRVTRLDGWLALGAHLPPKERRGVVFVDPPYEDPGDFTRLVDGLTRAVKRFAHGVYLLWYPIKAQAPIAALYQALEKTGIVRIMAVEMMVADPRHTSGLAGCGLVVVNPPFTLDGEIRQILPELTRLLAFDNHAGWRIIHIAGESAKNA